MSFLETETDAEIFKQQLIQYFLLKADQEVVTLLLNSKLECIWYSHDNWDGGFDIYNLCIHCSLDLYVRLEAKLSGITSKINQIANNLIHGDDQINSTCVRVLHNIPAQPRNQNLLIAAEKIKDILMARATGELPDETEYKNYRRILLSDQSIKILIPSFVKQCSNLKEFWIYIKPEYPTYALRRAHIVKEFQPLVNFLENPTPNPINTQTQNTLRKLNSEIVHSLWLKAIERLNGDPEGAITAANTLLEATIKSLLNELKVEYSDEKDDLPKLYRLLATKLNFSPSQHNEDIFKQILGGCQSIVQGLGALRNKISDAHVQGKKPVKPAIRHAELAVNAAGTMATFLTATWENHSIKS